MARSINHYEKTLKLLLSLKKKYPTYSFGRHISTAFAEYGDIWGTSDKECVFALEKYITQLELDELHVVSDDYVREIEEDAKHHLFDLNPDEEDGD